jgi:predicted nucleic acid-binding protein
VTPPTVLLDSTFLAALVESDSPDRSDARVCYARLLADYEANRIRLRARSDHLAATDLSRHSDLLAPIETIHVAQQFVRQALRLGDAVPPDVAVTLVVMRRESIERVATFDAWFDTIDVTVVR